MTETVGRYKYIDEGRNHLHTLDGKPLVGTSTIAKESINKGDGLLQWSADLAALCALGAQMAPEAVAQLGVEYEDAQKIRDWRAKANAMRAIDQKYPYFGEARKAAVRSRDGSAKKGTARHGVLEDYIRACISRNEGKPLKAEHAGIQMFIDWSLREVEKFYFTEGHCYSERLWIGGISDLGILLKSGKRCVGDHKSSKSAFFDQFIQSALYDIQLAENGILDRNGKKIGEWQLADGYVVFPFRSEPFTPEFRWNAAEYRFVAEAVVGTYSLKEFGRLNIRGAN